MLAFRKSETREGKPILRIFDGDNLIHSYVVCRNPEGKVGVYDLVEERFLEFTNVVDIRFGDLTWLCTSMEYDQFDVKGVIDIY